jgi:hypothetical protein
MPLARRFSNARAWPDTWMPTHAVAEGKRTSEEVAVRSSEKSRGDSDDDTKKPHGLKTQVRTTTHTLSFQAAGFRNDQRAIPIAAPQPIMIRHGFLGGKEHSRSLSGSLLMICLSYFAFGFQSTGTHVRSVQASYDCQIG